MARMSAQRAALHARAVRYKLLAGSVAALLSVGLLGAAIGSVAKAACRSGAWNVGVEQFQAHCYTDIYPLYFDEGLASGQIPYIDHHVEYPVLIGAAMQGAAWIVRTAEAPTARGPAFYDVTVALLSVCLVAVVLATARCAGRSLRWTGLLVALSPALVLAAFINWDLIAAALTMAALAAWAARRPVLAGILLGLAIATKFYPVIFLLPLFALCLRAGALGAFWRTACSATVVWLAVNLPVILATPSGWATFYVFSAQRFADVGSIWYFFDIEHWPLVGGLSVGTVNLLSAALFLTACVLVTALALMAPVRPRLPQLIFLAVAAFLLTNKVWSPQYVIWLVPLVVLARPRLGGYLTWQAAEVGYFYATWGYFVYMDAGGQASGAIGTGLYFTALLARSVAVLLLCALVVRDILQPENDIVRAQGQVDDPAGGILDGAADRLVVSWAGRAEPGRPAA